jgi:hypothetical protein
VTDCDVERTAGTGAFKACWDLHITCTNGGVMVGPSCAKVPAGETGVTVNLPTSCSRIRKAATRQRTAR